MLALKLKGQITSDRQLVVKLPKDIAPGTVDVIVLHEAPSKAPRRRARRKSAHPAFGIWAKRSDLTDSAAFAERLRQKVESRGNSRG